AGEGIPQEDPPGIIGIIRPDPVEAIDVLETLPDGATCLRFFALPGSKKGWMAFVLTPDAILVKGVDPTRPIDIPGDGLLVVIYEDPSIFPGPIKGPLALNASHLVRSIRFRKPFRRTVFSLGNGYSLPDIFKTRSLPSTATDHKILETLPGVNGLLLNTPLYLAGSVPTRPGQTPTHFMAMELDQGRTFPMSRLSGRLSNVSLAVLPKTSTKDAYNLGHMFSLFGVPTVLLPRRPQSASAFLVPFFKAYASISAEEAFQTALSAIPSAMPPKGAGEAAGEEWVLMGYWGMTPEEAGTFARKHFTRYVRSGVEAFKRDHPGRALTLFENALQVTSETQSLSRFLPDLYKYARESAYASGETQKAIQYAKALVGIIEKKQPDSEAHAEALLKLGLVLARAEQYEQAIPPLEEAEEILANLELEPEQISALADLGVILENATEYDRALVKLESAASLSKSLNKKELLAKQSMRIGRIYDLRLSQYARAKNSYQEAYSIYQELDQKKQMAQSLLDMGRCYRLMGNFKEARDHYDKAMALVQADGGDLRLEAKILMERANNGWYQARYQEAFELQKKVFDLAKENGWPLEKVMALNTSGLTWWTLGNHKRALSQLEEALSVARTLRARQDEVATTLNNMGLVYREMGQFSKALDALDKALTIDRKIKSRWAIAYDLRNKALTYSRMGKPEAAIPLFEEALATATNIGNRINEAKVLLGYGDALAALGKDQQAEKAYNRALKLSRAMALRETLWRALYGLGRLSLKRGNKQQARDLLYQSVQVIESMRAEIKLDQLKDGFIANKMAVYETLVSLLLELGKPTEAFDVSERSRARNLIDLLGNQRLTLHGAINQELYDRQKTLRARIREQEELLAQATQEAERSVYSRALERLHGEYKDLMLEIQVKNPELATLVSVNPLRLPGIQALLDPGVVLMAFYVIPDEILCWLITAESVELLRTPFGRETLGKLILDYRRMIQNLEPLEIQSKELHSLLLSKAVSKLGQARVLGIIPHGTLHYLSFATLFDGQNYLADRHSLFYLPSASVFRYTLKRRKAEKNDRVLAIANPDLRNPALDLPFAEREVDTIAWNFPHITLLTGEKATESWVIRHIDEFGIIHLASHGEFDPINPLFSSVKLTRDARADGNLEASEVFGLRINADLVVLSACQTGLGRVTGGDDVIGMNRAFLYAGTHAMISTLWRVSDVSTAMLVKQFYRSYRGADKADSLRKAILHVKHLYPHPGYWGAFVLVGDYE
ncbi:MAG: CHAT domain-containing protein, partial [Desulfatiglandaceae bacterium]